MIVEASADLRTWTPIWTNALGAAPLLFRDPQTGLLPTRFYKVRPAP